MSCCEETLHAPPAIFGRLFVVDLAIVGMEAVLRAGIDVNGEPALAGGLQRSAHSRHIAERDGLIILGVEAEDRRLSFWNARGSEVRSRLVNWRCASAIYRRIWARKCLSGRYQS
jgi:hypothetical protein